MPAERDAGILDIEERPAGDGEPAGTLGSTVSLDWLCCSYDGQLAVDDVSLDIAPGSFCTILGPSGSGKTTTLMAIAGFVAPQWGALWSTGRT